MSNWQAWMAVPYSQRRCAICGEQRGEINYCTERQRWECSYCFFKRVKAKEPPHGAEVFAGNWKKPHS